MKKIIMIGLLIMLVGTPLTSSRTNYFSNSRDIEYTYLNNKLNTKISYNYISDYPVMSPIKVNNIKRISDLYGVRKKHPILNILTFHSGIDFSSDIGTPVRSTANGVVKDIHYSKYGYGNIIIIKHKNEFTTAYAHLQNIDVKKGQQINVGDVIGTVGNTGLSTGSHLHYEIRYKNKPINPLDLYNIEVGTKKELVNNYLTFLNDFESVMYYNI